jgi:hypoxanthine phosphoribosyltransferase
MAIAQLRADLAYWRPAAVVAATSGGSWPARVLTDILGKPAFQVGRMLVWRL